MAAGHVALEVAHRAELTQQHGFLHGGLVGTLADNALGYAAYSLMGADDTVLTVEYKISFIAPADGTLKY